MDLISDIIKLCEKARVMITPCHSDVSYDDLIEWIQITWYVIGTEIVSDTRWALSAPPPPPPKPGENRKNALTSFCPPMVDASSAVSQLILWAVYQENCYKGVTECLLKFVQSKEQGENQIRPNSPPCFNEWIHIYIYGVRTSLTHISCVMSRGIERDKRQVVSIQSHYLFEIIKGVSTFLSDPKLVHFIDEKKFHSRLVKEFGRFLLTEQEKFPRTKRNSKKQILFHSIPKTANMSWFITSKLMDASDRSNLKIVVMLTDLKPVLTDLMSNDKLLSLGKQTEIIIQKIKKLDSVRDDDEKKLSVLHGQLKRTVSSTVKPLLPRATAWVRNCLPAVLRLSEFIRKIQKEQKFTPLEKVVIAQMWHGICEIKSTPRGNNCAQVLKLLMDSLTSKHGMFSEEASSVDCVKSITFEEGPKFGLNDAYWTLHHKDTIKMIGGEEWGALNIENRNGNVDTNNALKKRCYKGQSPSPKKKKHQHEITGSGHSKETAPNSNRTSPRRTKK